MSVNKIISLPASLGVLLRKSIPNSQSNIDPLLYIYKFWRDTESLAKKQKEQGLKDILSNFELSEPEDKLAGEIYVLEYKVSERNTFDIELFKDKLLKTYPQLSRKVLQRLQDESKRPSPFRTYKVSEKI